jgi:hypothetical protein
MSESHGKKDPTMQMLDDAPLPQFPYVPRPAAQAPDTPAAPSMGDARMVKLRLHQIMTPSPGALSAAWHAADALYYLTGDNSYATAADALNLPAAAPLPAAPAPTSEAALQALVDQAQELNMGYGAPLTELAGELPPLPVLPPELLNMIGEYGMARTDGLGDLDRIHVWELLIDGVKAYARHYARAALAARQAPIEPAKDAITGGRIDNLADAQFYSFWYSHMQCDQMTGALADIKHSTARYIWDAARQVGAPDAERDAAKLNLCEHMWELQPTTTNARMTERCRFCYEIREIAIAKEKAQ